MVKILIAGDFAPCARVVDLFEEERYSEVLSSVVPITYQADYSIVNFEAPVVHSENTRPIEKCGPNLKCSTKAVKALKYAGFDMVTLANNHFYDYGDVGVKDTLKACQEEGIDVVGGGMNIKEASKTFYKEIKGVKFAFINCCEHEFSIATDKSGGANPIDPIKQFYAIQEAKKIADCVIIIVHGGHEYYQLPSPRMQELYRFFIDAGADVVVNHHQHCYSGYEVYGDKPIIYGLGNFCFDGNRCGGKSMWNEGYMVIIQFEQRDVSNKITFNITPYIQCKEKAEVRLMNKVECDFFYTSLKGINDIIFNDELLNRSFSIWCISKYCDIELALTPYSKRLFTGLWRRKILPSFLPTKRILNLYNKINCESHRDILLTYLNHKL